MNLKALLAFRAIVLDGSAAAAARRLNLSRPAISRLIGQLEHELRLTLFHRRNRRLTLTADGQAFYREAERILAGLQEIPEIAADIRERGDTGLRVIAMPRVAASWVSPAVAAFKRRRPDTVVRVDIFRRQELEQWIAGRHYDIGVGALPARHAEVKSAPIFRSRVCAVFAPDHPFASRASIRVADLLSERLIGIGQGLLPRTQTDELFSVVGAEVAYAVETSSTLFGSALAADGAGVMIADALSASCESHRSVAVPIEPARWMAFGTLTSTSATPTEDVGTFQDILLAEAQALSERGLAERID